MKSKARINYLRYIIPIIFAILLLHVLLHINIYNSKFSLTAAVISKYNPQFLNFLKKGNIENISQYIIALEILAVLALTLVNLLNFGKKEIIPKGISSIEVKTEEKKPGIHTDLDILYKMLKEKKRIPISKIAKAFNINKEMALDWCKTLETAELAEIQYSTLKEEVLALKENEKETKTAS